MNQGSTQLSRSFCLREWSCGAGGAPKIETDDLLAGPLNVRDLPQITGLWTKARELIAEINGAASLEFHDWQSIALRNMQYVTGAGNVEWMPIIGSFMATEESFSNRTV